MKHDKQMNGTNVLEDAPVSAASATKKLGYKPRPEVRRRRNIKRALSILWLIVLLGWIFYPVAARHLDLPALGGWRTAGIIVTAILLFIALAAGDRRDGRRLRTIAPMQKFMPYIMARRSDACNQFSDSLDISKTEKYCRQKVREGKTNFTVLHVFLAAYIRAISQYPALNRFISGQKTYARNEIVVVMTIKKNMRLDAEDTCIKVRFEPTDTADDVYEKFNAVVQKNQASEEEKSAFDVLNKVLTLVPGLLCRWMVKLLTFLDYFGWLPRLFTDLSPFHGSMIITSMGSLGIPPIYHHIYDFGNLPVFLAYGVKYSEPVLESDGTVTKHKFVDLKAVTDERICDGYYYAHAFRTVKKLFENPELLDTPVVQVIEDID